MLRLTRELVDRGFDSRHELLDLLMQINLMEGYTTLQGMTIEKDLAHKLAQLSTLIIRSPDRKAEEELKAMDDASVVAALELAFDVHSMLSQLVKPATPESLEASVPRQGWARIIWPRVTDILIATTFLAVAVFAIGTAYAGELTQQPNNQQRAFQQLAYLGAALLGASFSGLFTAYEYVQKRTFDPASGSSYTVRVVLGTVSGLILANIGFLIIGRAINTQGASGTPQPASILAAIGPGTLALVGGYSADAVNLILQRIADTLVTTVRGNADDAIKASQAQLKAESKTADFEQRQATVVALSELLKNATDDTLKNNLQTLMTAVGQGNVGKSILKPVKTNGDGVLNLTKEEPKTVDAAAANSQLVAGTQETLKSDPAIANVGSP
jgi:hypothetical protein